MRFSDQDYIALCRKQIEEKFAFGNGSGYTQRDLEALSRHIEERTGIILSLSTLKRLWKDDFKQRPQPATLNALAAVLDYRDWQDFRQQNPLPAQAEASPARKIVPKKKTGKIIVFALLLIAASFWMRRVSHQPAAGVKVEGPVSFTAQKTVMTGTPATVIFRYDLTPVTADSFFIQQSWNPAHRVQIAPGSTTYSSIYYESGYHRARLIANDTVLAMQPIHILSDGWEPRLYYNYRDREPVHFKKERFTGGGRLHINRQLLARKNVDLSRPFETRITNSRVYGLSSDNFDLVSRIKTDSLTGSPCPFMQVNIVTEKHFFWVNLQHPGCERNAGYKMGEVIRSGENNDLSRLGVDVYQWQEVGMRVENRKAEITLNGQRLFSETFREDFGNIMALTYIFSGTGSIDHVRLTGINGAVAFEDNFDQ